MQQVHHVNAIGFLEKEDFVDVLEHDFVVVGLAMKLCKVRVEVQAVVTTRDQHGNLGDRSYDLTRKLANVRFLVNFGVEQLGCSHVIVVIGVRFLFSILVLLVPGFATLFALLLFFLPVFVELVVWHVESHFAQNVANCGLSSTSSILNKLKSNFVLTAGTGERNVLVLDAEALLRVNLELKFLFFELVVAPIPALRR